MTRLALGLSAVLLCATAAAEGRNDQPRVFFAPEERSAITAERLQRMLHARAGTPSGSVKVAAPAGTAGGPDETATDSADTTRGSRPARIEGISLARDGRAAAWIGGRRYDDGARLAGYRLHVTRDGVRLIDTRGEGRLLKVGQAIGGLDPGTVDAP